MSGRQADKAPPAILVLKEVIRDYRAVNDPAGLGALLFPLEQCLSGEDYTPPKTGLFAAGNSFWVLCIAVLAVLTGGMLILVFLKRKQKNTKEKPNET